MYMPALAQGQSNTMGICETDGVLPVVPQFYAMAWGLPYTVAMARVNISVEELQKTWTGKFDKKVLRAQHVEGVLG